MSEGPQLRNVTTTDARLSVIERDSCTNANLLLNTDDGDAKVRGSQYVDCIGHAANIAFSHTWTGPPMRSTSLLAHSHDRRPAYVLCWICEASRGLRI